VTSLGIVQPGRIHRAEKRSQFSLCKIHWAAKPLTIYPLKNPQEMKNALSFPQQNPPGGETLTIFPLQNPHGGENVHKLHAMKSTRGEKRSQFSRFKIHMEGKITIFTQQNPPGRTRSQFPAGNPGRETTFF